MLTLFIMSKKGLSALEQLVAHKKTSLIAGVVVKKDPSVVNDYYEEITSLCNQNDLPLLPGDHKPDTAYSIAISWRWLIPEDKTRLIVLHDSLLPKYRGFAPLVNALINGESTVGVTAILGSKEYDKGDILDQKSVGVAYPIKISAAIDLITPLYADLTLSIYEKIEYGSLDGTPQNEPEATYSLWRDENDYLINWSKSSEEILRFIDAVGFPYKGASSYLKGKKVRILEAEIVNDVQIENRDHGKVIFLENKKPVVVCGKGLIKIITLTDDTGENMLPLDQFRSRFTSEKQQ